MVPKSGFDRDDEWGYRALEPSRCCISSIALVLLKTGITHSTTPTGERDVRVDYAQMATAQKLLLFWRKPAVSTLSYSRPTDICDLSVLMLAYHSSGSAGGMVFKSTISSRQLMPLMLLLDSLTSNCGQDESGRWNYPSSKSYIYGAIIIRPSLSAEE